MLHEAGFPVWFVIALGTYTLVQALRYRHGAAASDLVAAAGATLLAGVVASVWGVQMSLQGIREVNDPLLLTQLFGAGVKESLWNFDLGCGFAIAAALTATVGRRRADVATAA